MNLENLSFDQGKVQISPEFTISEVWLKDENFVPSYNGDLEEKYKQILERDASPKG
jgi:hypothetical protein